MVRFTHTYICLYEGVPPGIEGRKPDIVFVDKDIIVDIAS